MHEKRVTRAYHRELFGALALYTALLFAALHVGRPMQDGILRTMVLVSPMIGFGAGIWAIARHLGRIDEYLRRQMLENIALAAAITAGLSFTYGFLENAGFPRLSMFAVWCVLCGATGLVGVVRRLAGK